jgi:glutathione S-transferase
MSLTLYFHPLSSFCQKVMIALYENDIAFAPEIIDLRNEAEAAALRKIWPLRKFPVLRDEQRQRTVPESTIIIEYLAQYYPGKVKLVPADPERALEARERDRFYDLHIDVPLGKIVGDRLRPAGKNDPLGVEQARAQLETALAIVDGEMAERRWAIGDAFTMADCAAAPALFYVDMAIVKLGDTYKNAAAYLARLRDRPSYARVIAEAEPHFKLIPKPA